MPLVGEVDDPLGRGAVVEALEILADGFPGTALFVGGAHCARELADAATEPGMVSTIDDGSSPSR